MADSKVSLKLLIDTKGKRVLFAEANKEFVDFLFALLSLPVGTVTNLLKQKSMVGCLGNLYESIEKFSENYIQPNVNKDSILNPKTNTSGYGVQLLLPAVISGAKTFYACSSCYSNIADYPRATCPRCRTSMQREMSYVPLDNAKKSSDGEGGYVKGVVTYMIMDDLVVKPMSTISSITMLNKFNVRDVGALEEKIVDFGINEGLKLLHTSLQSETVLTTVFLGNMVA